MSGGKKCDTKSQIRSVQFMCLLFCPKIRQRTKRNKKSNEINMLMSMPHHQLHALRHVLFMTIFFCFAFILRYSVIHLSALIFNWSSRFVAGKKISNSLGLLCSCVPPNFLLLYHFFVATGWASRNYLLVCTVTIQCFQLVGFGQCFFLHFHCSTSLPFHSHARTTQFTENIWHNERWIYALISHYVEMQ